jgi:hypothetical protein
LRGYAGRLRSFTRSLLRHWLLPIGYIHKTTSDPGEIPPGICQKAKNADRCHITVGGWIFAENRKNHKDFRSSLLTADGLTQGYVMLRHGPHQQIRVKLE